MKNLLIALCVITSLGMTTAEAAMSAARALTQTLVRPFHASENISAKAKDLNAYRRDVLAAVNMTQLEASMTGELERKLETLMETDPLLENFANNLAKEPLPELFVEDGNDLNVLAKLLARASGQERDPALFEKFLTKIKSTSSEEMIASFNQQLRLEYSFLGPKDQATKDFEKTRKYFKWRKYLFGSL